MIQHSLKLVALLGLLLAAIPRLLLAQSNVITANLNAQPLRKIWELRGRMEDRMGSGFGSVGDINGDSLDDFAVCEERQGLWHVFYGRRDSALSTTPVWTFDSTGAVPNYPIHGNFLGTGRQIVGFPRGKREIIDNKLYFDYYLYLFRTDSFRLDTAHPLLLDLRAMTPPITSQPEVIAAYDLDLDGYDDLVLYFGGIWRNWTFDRHPEVWIYRGGPDFKVDTPTVILRDTEEENDYGFQLYVGRFDDDPYPDLMYGFLSSTSGSRLVVHFGREGSPWNWNEPDRTLTVGALVALDCDGDSILDFAEPKPSKHVAVYLSGRGKSLRTRSLTPDDADLSFEGAVGIAPERFGYLSDSSHRFEMLGIQDRLFHMGFSGGPAGPDPAYDTYNSEIFAPPYVHPLGDVSGDGWSDLITGLFSYENRNGVARVFAGGPYIPRDPSSGVQTLPTDERADAIHIWPNPTTTELHIAWRGDLKQMPRGFSVFAITGQLVAHGEVASWRGEAYWNCTGVAAGNYLLSIYDYTGALITTTTITKY